MYAKLRGEYRSLRFEDDGVEHHKKHKMHLTPGGMQGSGRDNDLAVALS